ncbi:hypothetical protein SmJEL517_g02691 [Synchytrium microbalum]|uniref:Dynamin-binding protein n=1 Tax=Synchytrium microbalum TaxID=1806994 RepID=A0A507C0U9_9FUNG|nr:uncharacterized protein SmJEL517_g02691 [Synchytrium microbalum]TPX34717.1 hypothetical protein SmJEL517_g02691 [Synchytrium microbalum]
MEEDTSMESTEPRKRVGDLAKMFEQSANSNITPQTSTSRPLHKQTSAATFRSSVISPEGSAIRKMASSVAMSTSNSSTPQHSSTQQPWQSQQRKQPHHSKPKSRNTSSNNDSSGNGKRSSAGSDSETDYDAQGKRLSVSRLSRIFEAEDANTAPKYNGNTGQLAFGVVKTDSGRGPGSLKYKSSSASISTEDGQGASSGISLNRSLRNPPPVRPAKPANLSADPIIIAPRPISPTSVSTSSPPKPGYSRPPMPSKKRSVNPFVAGPTPPPSITSPVHSESPPTASHTEEEPVAVMPVRPLAERIAALNAGAGGLTFEPPKTAPSLSRTPSVTRPIISPNSPVMNANLIAPPSPMTRDSSMNREGTPPPLTELPESAYVGQRSPISEDFSRMAGRSSPFSPPTSSTPVPSEDGGEMTEEDQAKKRESRRRNVLKELVDTERSFLNDMEVLRDVFYYPSIQTGVLSESDVKILFSNLESVIDVSRWFLSYLDEACVPDDDYAGDAFMNAAPQLEEVFTEFCKHNESSVTRLQELAGPTGADEVKEFLKSAQGELAGRTQAWDLGSLLIKPVQRVLKYPLLIKQLIKDTTSTHSDFQQLGRAYVEMERIAEKINEVKRRKDIVEKYVEGKGSTNIVRGINKKLARGTQRVKEGVGLSKGSVDTTYEALSDRFESLQRDMLELRQACGDWIKSVREYSELEDTFATAWDEVYSIDRGSHVVSEYRKASARISASLWRDADTRMKGTVYSTMDSLQGQFKNPTVLMKKRDAKLLDFNRVKEARTRGDPVDRALAESADTYTSMNAQLVEELPKFLSLVESMIDIIVVRIVTVQAQTYYDLHTIMNILPPGAIVDGLQVVPLYQQSVAVGGTVESAFKGMGALSKWRRSIWGDQTTSSEAEYLVDGIAVGAGFAAPDRALSPDLSDASSTHAPFGRPAPGSWSPITHSRTVTGESESSTATSPYIPPRPVVAMPSPKLGIPTRPSIPSRNSSEGTSPTLRRHNSQSMKPSASGSSLFRPFEFGTKRKDGLSSSSSTSITSNNYNSTNNHQSNVDNVELPSRPAPPPRPQSNHGPGQRRSRALSADRASRTSVHEALSPTSNYLFDADVVYAFDPEDELEVRLEPGDVVRIERLGAASDGSEADGSEDWWFGEIIESSDDRTGTRGWVPRLYLEPRRRPSISHVW